MDEVFRMEDISNHFEAQIQDDCIWSISKNEPLANHLRYIVAILNSVKDLERMGDYAVSAIRFFANNQVSDEIRNLIVAILKEALTGMNKVINSLKVKPATDTYQICRAAHTLFKKRYSKMLEQLSGILKNRSVEQIEKLFQGAIIIIKHIERLMDHLANISENFVFIKQPDLFFTKQSKQKNK
jgi:phosphate transport system protein